MSFSKALPSLPDRRRRVKIVTPPSLPSAHPSTRVENSRTQPGNSAGASFHGLPPSPYPPRLRPENGNDDQVETDEDASHYEEDDDDDSDKDFKLLKAKFLPVVSLKDEVAALQDQVAALQKENATLRKQPNPARSPGTRDQDRVITRLREENEQLKRATREQNQHVARIAQTITAAFREYQNANGFSSSYDDHSGDGSSENSKPLDNSSVIQVYSQFDTDSESDY